VIFQNPSKVGKREKVPPVRGDYHKSARTFHNTVKLTDSFLTEGTQNIQWQLFGQPTEQFFFLH
jgi:hypothetical protein